MGECRRNLRLHLQHFSVQGTKVEGQKIKLLESAVGELSRFYPNILCYPCQDLDQVEVLSQKKVKG